MTAQSAFEIDDTLTVRYSYGYGGITPFFRGLIENPPVFKISRCAECALAFCPPRIHCQVCWQPTEWVDHSGEGAIESLVWAYWVPLDSPARQWTDLPYAYAAVRVDGCHNLIRVRVTGLDRTEELQSSTGRRGHLSVASQADGRAGDLVFEVLALGARHIH
jgi:uncharacterized OB-fold protein